MTSLMIHMAGRPIIVLGDATDHGGQVISGDMTATIEGKPIARVGDMVNCPKCNGTFPIVEGVMDTMFSTMPVAVHGHKTACGATLIGSQTLFLVHVDSENTWRSAPAPVSVSALSRKSDLATDAKPEPVSNNNYDDKFQLLDSVSHAPLRNHSYAIERESGQIEYGETDDQGHTHLLSAIAKAENIKIYVEG